MRISDCDYEDGLYSGWFYITEVQTEEEVETLCALMASVVIAGHQKRDFDTNKLSKIEYKIYRYETGPTDPLGQRPSVAWKIRHS